MDEPLLRLPPLDPLRGFVVAARHLSFTRAAEALCLTQSAISRQIQTLETALGLRLFERGTRQLALTPAGAQLLREAEGWLMDYAALAERLRAGQQRRPVTVTASIGIATLWLVPRLAQFQQQYPEIDVRLAAGNRLLDLRRDGIDVAIRYCADKDAPEGAERLFGESVLPVASPALGLTVLDEHTLPGVALLDFDDPLRYSWLRWDYWLSAMGLEDVAPRARLSFSHYDQLVHAAAAGQGVAIGRAQLVDRMIANGQLMALSNPRHEVAGRGFWLITAAADPPESVRRFTDWVRAEGALSLAESRSH